MPEPRQLNPVQLDIDAGEPAPGDFTVRVEAAPKDSFARGFVTDSPPESPPLVEQSDPQSSSADSISTPQSLEPSPSLPPSSADSPEKSASVEKAPTPQDIPITRSENPIPLPPKGNVAMPPPLS